MQIHELHRFLDRFLFRREVEDREPADDLFRFGERTVRGDDFPTLQPNGRSLGTVLQAAERDHLPRLGGFLAELTDRLE